MLDTMSVGVSPNSSTVTGQAASDTNTKEGDVEEGDIEKGKYETRINNTPHKKNVRFSPTPSFVAVGGGNIGILLPLTSMAACLVGILVGIFLMALGGEFSSDKECATHHKQDEENISSKKQHKLCTSKICIAEAFNIIDKMDTSHNPCEDFHEYACGNLLKDKSHYNPFGALLVDINRVLSDILRKEIRQSDREYVKKMKTFYRSCLNLRAIDEIGVTSYMESEHFKQWPTINNKTWQNKKKNNLDVASLVTSHYIFEYGCPFFKLNIRRDLMKLSKWSLYIDRPSLGLSSNVLNTGRSGFEAKVYEAILSMYAQIFGASLKLARADADAVVDLTIKLVNITSKAHLSFNDMYNPILLGELGDNYTFFGIPQTIRSLGSSVGVTLDDDETVIVMYPSYIDDLRAFYDSLNETELRTLQNLFSLTYIRHKGSGLITGMRYVYAFEERYNFSEIEPNPDFRNEYCLEQTMGWFTLALSKGFTSWVSFNASSVIDDMIDRLTKVFAERLRSSTWIGNQTRAAALDKLKNVGREIGEPSMNFDDDSIDEIYKDVKMDPHLYGSNRETMMLHKTRRHFQRLHIPVHRSEWSAATFSMNAYYSLHDNAIVLPVAFLRPPLFVKERPSILNMAVLGGILGHELSHGFDKRGSGFDKNGAHKTWMEKEDQKKLEDKLDCLINQYDNFREERIDLSIKGKNVIAEAAADLIGILLSYRAYKEMEKESDDYVILPGIDLTPDQLFFVAAAQIFCQKLGDKAARSRMTANKHPLGRFRVAGIMQNNYDFAKAFNCPVGSPMNPETKCSIW